MAFNIIGAITGALTGLFYSGNPFGALVGFAAGGFLTDPLLEALTPELPTPPKAIEQGGQAYRAQFRNNDVQPGDVKSVGYGLFRSWPRRITSYVVYTGNEQYYYFVGEIGFGIYDVQEINIGETGLNSFPGQDSEVLLPGEAQTIGHPNVFTSPDVVQIEMRGGTTGTISKLLRLRFTAADNSIDTLDRDQYLATIPVGQTINITGTVGNDGAYTVTASGIDRQTILAPFHSYLDVAESVVDEDADFAVVDYSQVTTNAKTIKVEDVPINFVSGPVSSITSDDGVFIEFAVGDKVSSPDSVLNVGTVFEVLGSDSSTLLVAPTPVDEILNPGTLSLVQRWSGPVAAAPEGEKANRIEIDVLFDGLGKADGGGVVMQAVTFQAEWQEVDDYDNALGAWQSDVFSLQGDAFKPWRFTHGIDLPAAIRPAVRLTRLTVESDDSNIRDSATWIGLKGYLEDRPGEDSRVDTESTRIAMRVRASGLLSREQQQTVNTLNQRLLPIYDTDTETWSDPAATRSAYWACIDWLLTQSRGRLALPNLNLPKFAELAADADEREAYFDAQFDAEVLLKEGAQSIVATDRSRLRLDRATGTISPFRDEQTPSTLLLVDGLGAEMGDINLGGFSSDQPTGIRMNFVDALTGKERDDGPVVGTEERLQEISFFGCTDWQRAYDEAFYRRRLQLYRGASSSVNTEMLGLLSEAGTRILYASSRHGFGQGGNVKSTAGSTLQVVQAPLWTEGDVQHYVYLQHPGGSHGAKINVTQGDSPYELILASAPDVTFRFDRGAFNTQFVFGHDGNEDDDIYPDAPLTLVMLNDSPNGLHATSLNVVIDDDRVYEDAGTAPVDPRAPTGAPADLTIATVEAYRTSLTLTAEWSDAPAAEAYEAQQYLYDTVEDEPVGWERFFFSSEDVNESTIQRKPGLQPQKVRVRAYAGRRIGPWTTVDVVEYVVGTEGMDLLATESGVPLSME